jgi:hypothetical protein
MPRSNERRKAHALPGFTAASSLVFTDSQYCGHLGLVTNKDAETIPQLALDKCVTTCTSVTCLLVCLLL